MKEKIQNHFKGNYKAFYERFLQDIKDGKNSEFKALCPFHDDHNPSFNFNNQDGKYFCHSCQAGGDIFHFYAKLNGLDLKSDFYKILEGIVNEYGISWIEEKPHIVKTYDYVDAHDNLLFQVVRMDPKDFRQRRPDGKDGWIWNLNGIQRVLYRLPEVLKAKEVFIVEGEKDADTLVDLELTATTCPMGAKKWRPEYNESLKGKDIVLIPDNDNEGQEHMTQVGASLDGLVKSLKLIELPGLPNKGDVSDFVARFDDKIEAAEKVCIMVEGAGPYEPPKKATLEDAILKAEEFINNVEIPPKDKILEPWFNEQTITLISAPRGIGKTWLAMSLVDAISRGEPFGPWKLKKSVPCTYIEGEMAAQDVRDRLHALNRSEAPRLQGGASKRKL
ncbi:MAG: AAA family ATPase [Deltaproteobacteria bacterium]|nr:MAG: AAA family ATPase [Deltaproteobacteria bacterium]